ncbi:MAG: DUF4261 domain-containing protein [Clostridiales bacterium]|nr:DUF4261 domain-containing protein [Clostridiales bacterium]
MASNTIKNKTAAFEMPVADILLESAQYSFDAFVRQFKQKWHIEAEPYKDKGALGMIIDGRVLGCAFIPRPVDDALLLKSARGNVLWLEAAACVAKHKAHLKVAMTREGDPVTAHILFSKVICSLLQQKNAMGVYLRPGLLESSYYKKYAEGILDGKLPAELWVHVNTLGFDSAEGFSLYTSGMRKFGKKEFELLETDSNFIDAFYSLRDLVKYTIENDVSFKDGDTVGSDGNKVLLSVSQGVTIKGVTVKMKM